MTARRVAAPAIILAVGCVILAINLGVRQTMGLFVEPVSLAHGWGGETFSLAIGLQNLLWGAAQPFAGALAERYGTGRMLAGSTVVYVVGLVLMGLAQTPGALHLSAGLLIGLGLSGSSFPIIFASIARSVPEARRSWALGIAGAGGSFGQFVFSPFSQLLIDDIGWVASLMVLAAVCAMIIPLALPMTGRASKAAGQQSLGAALKEARQHRGYWYLTAGFFVCGFHVAFLLTHLKPYVGLCGLAPMVGASALALIGLFNIAGSLAAGALGSRFRKKHLLSLIYLGRSIVIAVFMLGPKTEVTVLLFAATIGLLWLSTVPLTSGLIAQIFDPRYLATLFGVVFFSHQVGAFFGAWLGGRTFDATGSYDSMWVISILLGLLAAALHWPIGDRPVPRLTGRTADA